MPTSGTLPAMNAARHLRILSILDYVSAALAGLGALLLGGITVALLVTALAAGDPQLRAALLPTVAIEGVTCLFVAACAAVFALAGRQIGRGRGRVLQTVLAVIGVCNFPLGTAFAAYALWVCWIDDDTVAILSGEAPLEG